MSAARGGSLSRRGFLARAGTLACACCLPGVPGAALATSIGQVALRTPRHDQVRLLDGPMQLQFQQQLDLFMGIGNDELLKPFRKRAGLPARGEDMGGWYDDSADFHIDLNDWSTANWHGYIPGHSFGQYVSGLSRMHAATGRADIREKVEALVDGYLPTIGGGFFEDYNLPAYTYNKTIEGLLDAHHFAGVGQASLALERLTDAVLPYLPEKALTREERRQRPYTREAQIWDEPYVLPENLFRAWEFGLGERYRRLAIRFLQDEALFGPLARGSSPFQGKHAYSHVNALNSAIHAHAATGDAKYLRAARNGFDFVQAQSFATGGWGPNEELLAPDDATTLAASLQSTHRHFETPCGAHAHFKLTRSLLAITGDSRYGDSMERVLCNTMLGARPTTAAGDTFYYSDYAMQARKGFRGEAWPCCSGTFVQLVSDYAISAYQLDDAGAWVNLYVPSRLAFNLHGREFVLEQRTDYPLTDHSRLELRSGAGRFTLRLRIPAWAGPATRVLVNGTAASGAVAGRFFTLDRDWQQGDRIELRFDMPLRLEALDAHHPDLVALLVGPLVLFPLEPGDRPTTRADLLSAKRQSDATWKTAGGLRLKPFMAIGDEAYRLYSQVTD